MLESRRARDQSKRSSQHEAKPERIQNILEDRIIRDLKGRGWFPIEPSVASRNLEGLKVSDARAFHANCISSYSMAGVSDSSDPYTCWWDSRTPSYTISKYF